MAYGIIAEAAQQLLIDSKLLQEVQIFTESNMKGWLVSWIQNDGRCRKCALFNIHLNLSYFDSYIYAFEQSINHFCNSLTPGPAESRYALPLQTVYM